ncbi:PhzF family phenazine biosynthesis protein [Herbiconiux sp. CPCC 205716]|uniref:PhzF family phenazine biosynthesis protein n=1 Tax=Herbiconiux gentiana TaxID=2970912 RepID=A0ABT2GG15_9MICO|nr:PhzF family phenazine biosynthesis protein [Herbiconiux gentiana]MCS5715150.1 PhzF family phenazine biosynthesis protein [Herbiconiux gentiana]
MFTDDAGHHGNPLGIVVSSERTRGAEQSIATALGFSETVFFDGLTHHDSTEPGGPSGDEPAGVEFAGVEPARVEPVGGGAAGGGAGGRRASIRIFTPARELPFAGHPCVGTAWWLARRGTPVAALDTPAGRVTVREAGELVWITGRADWSPDFAFAELGSPAEVDALDPADFPEGRHYPWAWVDEAAGHLRSRMFAPALGVPEDQATGSAAVALTTRLGRDLTIDQGVGARLRTRLLPDGTVEVGGRTAPAEPRTLSLRRRAPSDQ